MHRTHRYEQSDDYDEDNENSADFDHDVAKVRQQIDVAKNLIFAQLDMSKSTKESSELVFGNESVTFYVEPDIAFGGGSVNVGLGSECEMNNTHFTGSWTNANGGAVRIEASLLQSTSLLLELCTFRNCTAQSGPAIWSLLGNVRAFDTDFGSDKSDATNLGGQLQGWSNCGPGQYGDCEEVERVSCTPGVCKNCPCGNFLSTRGSTSESDCVSCLKQRPRPNFTTPCVWNAERWNRSKRVNSSALK